MYKLRKRKHYLKITIKALLLWTTLTALIMFGAGFGTSYYHYPKIAVKESLFTKVKKCTPSNSNIKICDLQFSERD